MELNLFSTDGIYANVNVVFDDSIYQAIDDTVFELRVNQRFNSSITFPSYANSVRILGNPSNFNQPINLPPNAQNLSHCFRACPNFNQPVTIPNTAINCTSMFYGCSNFNQPIAIPNSVDSTYDMFDSATNFNQPVTLPVNLTSCYSMFWATAMNSPVTIPNGVESCYGLFKVAGNFNQSINIPDSVTNTNQMFDSATKFNSEVSLGNNIIDCGYMFNHCLNFNQSINIPNSVTQCNYMFQNTYSFNKPLEIPNGVLNCMYMFQFSTEYNSTVIIPSSVINTAYMFNTVNSCPYNFYNSRFAPFDNNALKAPIYFYANNVQNAQYMFQYCNSMSDLYLIGLQNNMQLNRFMRNNGTVRCNIYTDDVSQNHLYNTYLLTNLAKPTWTNDTDNGCIYNTAMNLYIYNNWDGSI